MVPEKARPQEDRLPPGMISACSCLAWLSECRSGRRWVQRPHLRPHTSHALQPAVFALVSFYTAQSAADEFASVPRACSRSPVELVFGYTRGGNDKVALLEVTTLNAPSHIQ